MSSEDRQAAALERIADALERISPAPQPIPAFDTSDGYVWRTEPNRLNATEISRVPLHLLLGVDRAKATIMDNTRRFAEGLPANNALLWGARGMGKSSLVKAAHGAIAAEQPGRLALIEIQRDDIPTIGQLLQMLRGQDHRFLLFCDDLSFDKDDSHYKSLKAVLDGGVEGRPENVIFYATSNRRHLMPRDMIENERSSGINPSEATEEKVSLSDRFGLWIGFHPCSQDDFLAIIDGYVEAAGLKVDADTLRAEAIEWRQTRGSVSGRVAWQFVNDLAGRLGQPLKLT